MIVSIEGECDRPFKETDTTELTDALEEYFFRTKRDPNEDMISYISKFMTSYRKIEAREIRLPDKIQAYSLGIASKMILEEPKRLRHALTRA